MSVVATWTVLSPGVITMGLVTPLGVVPIGKSVQVGNFVTQTTVLNTWADGSTRHSLVSFEATSIGPKDLTLIPSPGGSYAPQWPSATITLTERVNNAKLRYAPNLTGVGTGGSTRYFYRSSCVSSGAHESFPSRIAPDWLGLDWNAVLSGGSMIRVQDAVPTGSVSYKVYGRSFASQALLTTGTPSTPTVSSITAAGRVATVTISVAHNLVIGDRITVSGCAQSAYNGVHTVETTPTGFIFTYSTAFLVAAPSSPATGTPVITYFIYYDDGSVMPTGAYKTSAADDPGTVWTATLPAFDGTHTITNGFVCRKAWVRATFMNGGTPHSDLRAKFEVTNYVAGGRIVDSIIYNIRNSTTIDRVQGDLVTTVAGVTVAKLTQTMFTIYVGQMFHARTTTSGLIEAVVLHDFEPWIAANVIPRFSPSVDPATYDLTSPKYQLGGGFANPTSVPPDNRWFFGEAEGYMQDSENAGRQELNPWTDWEARLFALNTEAYRQTVLANADVNGGWAWQCSRTSDDEAILKSTDDSNGTTVCTDQTAGIRKDSGLQWREYQNVGEGIWLGVFSNGEATDGTTAVEREHLNEMVFVAYLLTGNTFYLDLLRYQAGWTALTVVNADYADPLWPGYTAGRNGNRLEQTVVGMHRGFGRPLKKIARAAWGMPDTYAADQTYLKNLVQYNLEAVAAYDDYLDSRGWDGGAWAGFTGFDSRTQIRDNVVSSTLGSTVGATAKYVATTGNDSTGTGAIGAPWQTLGHATLQLVAGDLLYVRGGNYFEILTVGSGCASGTSFSNAITVQAYPGETVTSYAIKVNGGRRYWIFQDLKLSYDVINDGPVNVGGGELPEGTGAGFIRFINIDVTGSTGGTSTVGIGVQFSAGSIGSNEFIGGRVHHINWPAPAVRPASHGFYVSCPNNLVQGVEMDHIAQYAVHNFSGSPNNNRYIGNNVHDTGTSGYTSGGFLISGDNNLVSNNIIENNANGIIFYDFGGSPTGNKAYNNTLYRNGNGRIDPGSNVYPAIHIGVSQVNAEVKNNLLFGNFTSSVDDVGTGSVVNHNSTVDPLYVNAATADFHLQSGSPAIDAGLTLTAVPTDYAGVARPDGAAYDIGAYERSGGGSGSRYVSLTGSDITGTGTLGAPWRTIANGVAQLVAGNTLYVRGGTYVESVTVDGSYPNGTNWTTGAITVQAYPGETVWLIPGSGATAIVISEKSYWIWSGINIDGIHLGSAVGGALNVNGGDHVRFQNATITNAYWCGIVISQTIGFGTYYQFLNLLITNGGRAAGAADPAHGIYIAGSVGATPGLSTHHLISQCEVSGFTALSNDSGIDVYAGPSATDTVGGTTVDRCYIHGNSVGSFLADATTVPIVYTNNRVTHNTYSGVVLYARLAVIQVFNNTIHANGDRGIEVGTQGAVTGALIKNNAITSNGGRGIIVYNVDPTSYATITFNDLNGNGNNAVDDQNSLSTIASNITTAPAYVNAAANDYHLAGGSGNIDAGTTLSSVTTDADGVARPQGAAYDIGAYER